MKKTFILLLFTAFFVVSCTNNQVQNKDAEVTNLSAIEFSNTIKENATAPIIDVRTPNEFEKGHLQNAKNIDWNGNDFDTQTNTIDKNKPVFVYCLSGGRSASAANAMRSNGFKKVYELDGGIMKWRAENLPETTSNKIITQGMSLPEYTKQVASKKIVLVDFYADWCVPCKKMKPYLDEIAIEYKDSVLVLRINADNNQVLCKQLKIDVLPTLKLYKNNALTWSTTGYIDKPEVLKQFN